MNEIVINHGSDFRTMNVEEYLKAVVNYHWLDIVRFSLEYNISVRRMIIKLVESGGLMEINKENISVIVKYIDNKLWEIRQKGEY